MVENGRGEWQGIFLHNRTLNSRLNEMDFTRPFQLVIEIGTVFWWLKLSLPYDYDSHKEELRDKTS